MVPVIAEASCDALGAAGRTSEELVSPDFGSGETAAGSGYFFFAPFLAAAFFGAGLLALDFTVFWAIILFELSIVCVRND